MNIVNLAIMFLLVMVTSAAGFDCPVAGCVLKVTHQHGNVQVGEPASTRASAAGHQHGSVAPATGAADSNDLASRPVSLAEVQAWILQREQGPFRVTAAQAAAAAGISFARLQEAAARFEEKTKKREGQAGRAWLIYHFGRGQCGRDNSITVPVGSVLFFDPVTSLFVKADCGNLGGPKEEVQSSRPQMAEAERPRGNWHPPVLIHRRETTTTHHRVVRSRTSERRGGSGVNPLAMIGLIAGLAGGNRGHRGYPPPQVVYPPQHPVQQAPIYQYYNDGGRHVNINVQPRPGRPPVPQPPPPQQPIITDRHGPSNPGQGSYGPYVGPHRGDPANLDFIQAPAWRVPGTETPWSSSGGGSTAADADDGQGRHRR